MALGIASFAILSLTGLSSVALNKVKDSKQNILWVNMTQEVASKLRSMPWSDLSALSLPTSFYFDDEGKEVDSAGKALYECLVTEVSDTLPNQPATLSDSYLQLVLTLRRIDLPNSSTQLALPILLGQYDASPSLP